VTKTIGKRLPRLEDRDLLRGKARFVDDIHIEGVLHAVFVRSPHAHARIGKIDGHAALAADGVYARLTEVSQLLHDLRGQADALVHNDELQAVLQRERSWLDQAQRTMEEARRWRELEMRRFWPGVWRRWALALVFALASAAAAGAGYAWVTSPYAGELATLRSRAEFDSFVEHRLLTMTAVERRQFDALMKRKTKTESNR